MLATLRQLRASVAQGRQLVPPKQKSVPRWDLHEQRLKELERQVLQCRGPADLRRCDALYEEFMLDHQADMAASRAEVGGRLVRFIDMVARKAEEKKFELTTEQREGLDEMLEPYKDKFREEMLGSLPIEMRRQLEAENRRLEEE